MEVGKKYKYDSVSTLFECVAIAPDGRPVVIHKASSQYGAFTVPKENLHKYKEVKEPIKKTVWIVIRKDNYGFHSLERAMEFTGMPDREEYKVVRTEYEDDKLVNVVIEKD